MADPRELLLGTPEEVDDYRRWEAGRNANTLNPNGVVADAKKAAQYLWDNKGNLALSALAPPSAHIAAAVLAEDDKPEQQAAVVPVRREDAPATATPPGAEPPVRYTPGEAPPVRSAPTPAANAAGAPGSVGPRTHQEMLDSPIFGDAYRASLLAGDEPLSVNTPPPVQSPAARAPVDPGGAPGKVGPALEDMANDPFFGDAYREYENQSKAIRLVTPEDDAAVRRAIHNQVGESLSARQAAQDEASALRAAQFGDPTQEELLAKVNRITAEELASREAAAAATRVASGASKLSRLEALAAKLGPAADAVAVGTLPFAAAAALGLKAVDMTPEAELRHISFGEGQGPLDMGMIGRHVSALRANPDLAKKLWADGVISTPAYAQIMEGAGAPSYEPMVNAMRRLNAVQ